MLFTALLLAVQTVAGAAGHWEGTIAIPDHEMGITVDLDKTAAGVWIGSLSISMSTSIDVPLAGITIEGASVRFSASVPGKTSFEGTLTADATGLSGKVSNLDGSVPFTLARRGDPNVKVPPPSSALSKPFEGTWEGGLDVGGKTLKVVVTLAAAPDGTAIGTLVSRDGVASQEIPISTVTITGAWLELESRAVSGTYRGTLGPGGEIAGEWTQRAAHAPLVLRRAGS